MPAQKSSATDADLEKIWLDAAREYGVAHAERVLMRIDELIVNLSQFPHMGREHPRLRDGVRYFPVRVYPFLVFFKHTADGIRIVRVLPDRVRVEDHF